ncbi:hypothetical protein MMC31_004820 [Peltigera leucophlebia]|nr:hypothetical protein [Peltigera leucophlebia]
MQSSSAEAHGVLTPPPSPNKRRHMIRESEETDEEMTLDAFLYRSDDFRKSTFENPWPLPLQLDEPKPAFRLFGPLFKGLVPKIRQVLAEHSIKQNQSWADIYLASKPGFPGGDIPVLTLVVLVDQGVNNSRTWGDAKDEVHQLFAEDNFPNVEVELYDPKRSFVPTMFPLQPHTEAIIKYQSKRDQLIKCLQENLPGMWSAMSVFGFGPTAAEAEPALVVFIRPFSVQNWNQLGKKLSGIFANQEWKTEFVPGGVSINPGISFARHSGFGAPDMGSSIGEKGQPGGGTLGGVVSLKRKEQTMIGLITNHHVVRPSSPKSKATIDLVDEFGYGSNQTASVKTIMQYPAKLDFEATSKDLNDQVIPEIKQSIKNMKDKINRFNMKGQDVPDTLSHLLEVQEDELDMYKKQLDKLKRLPTVLGDVVTSSGNALSPSMALLDWAIVQVPSSKVPQPPPNKLPSTDEVARSGKSARDYGVNDQPYRRLPSREYVGGFSKIEKGSWYFKIGRTTGITTGICHGIEVDVGRQGEVRYDHSGKKVILGKYSTRELVIMSSTGTFSEPGDSGSFVFNNLGNVAGLLYGELTGNITSGEVSADTPSELMEESHFTDNTVMQGCRVHIGSGLVSSMDEVLGSIKKTTGAEISFNLKP